VPYVLEGMGGQWYCQGFVSGFQRPSRRFTDVGKVLKKAEPYALICFSRSLV